MKKTSFDLAILVCKGCGARRRADLTEFWMDARPLSLVATRALWRSDRTGEVRAELPTGAVVRNQYGRFLSACTCGKWMVGNRLQGRWNPGVPCNGKCTGAVGHLCECSCGGANHGRNHG